MHLPTNADHDYDVSELLARLPIDRLRHRWVAQIVVVAASGIAAVLWSSSLHSEPSARVLASDNSPTVVAGEPSASIRAAAAAATPGSTGPVVLPPGSTSNDQPGPAAPAESDGQPSAGPAPTALGAGQPAAASTPVTATGDAPAAIAQPSSATDNSDPTGYKPPSPSAPSTGSPAPPISSTPPTSSSSSSSSPSSSSPPVTSSPPATSSPQTNAPPAPPPDRPTRVFPANNAQRLTTDQLVKTVRENNITNVADFLSALPAYMGESYTLMEESKSRHKASIDYPRLIMYGPDARLLIGVSSHPSDPLREVVELAELNESTGRWRFSQFDFRNGFAHDTTTESCAGCHGSPLRPIWGEYPDWPGAFAGQDERLTGAQAASLMQLKADPLDRFHRVVFPSDHSIQNNGQLYLPSRDYGYANTSFNFELNAAVADGIARRILNHPNWPSQGYDLLAAQWDCGGNVDSAQLDAFYNGFGVDGNNDFQLESRLFEANAGQRDEYDWNQGSTGLDDSVAFRTLDLASQRDAELGGIVRSDQLFVTLSNGWFGVLGAERAEFLRYNGIYDIDFRPQNLSGAFVNRVCDHLTTAEAGR